MTKVFSCPDEVPAPRPDFRNYDFNKVQADEKAHQERLKGWLKDNGYNGANTGRIFTIPHADGYAIYMVAEGSRRFHLIHLPYGDGWDSPDVQFLPKAEILRRLTQHERIASLFGGK